MKRRKPSRKELRRQARDSMEVLDLRARELMREQLDVARQQVALQQAAEHPASYPKKNGA